MLYEDNIWNNSKRTEDQPDKNYLLRKDIKWIV